MKEYYLEFAGLHILLQTPYEITISENLRPFLSQKGCSVDCAITLRVCDQLPAFFQGGVWHGPEYYDSVEGVSRVFFCVTPHMTPIVVTEYFEDGNIRISIAKEHLSGVTGSSGVLNYIGIENLLLQHCGLLLMDCPLPYRS